MRGSPLLRALLVFALLLCFAPILWQMTRPNAAVEITPKAAITAEQEIAMELAFTTAPSHVSITHLGKTVWEKEKPEASEEVTLKLPWPSEGGELLFRVDWPDALSAMRVKLNEPQRGLIERSLWGRGTKSGVLKFP